MIWFTDTFLPSFKKCKNKKITEKQADIFDKYMPELDKFKHQETKGGMIETAYWEGKTVIFERKMGKDWYSEWYVTII